MDTPDQPTTIDRPTDLPGAPMSACLGFDHPCLKCDYNLRGLAINASCPECNSAVTDSLKRRLFRHADPRFVRKLRGGARMIAISSILPIPSLILVVMFMMTTAVVGGSGGLLLGAIVPIILIVLIWGLFLFGWIRLTAKEFDTASDGQANKDRARCRLLSILLAFAIPASFILSIGSFSFAMAATGSMAGTVWMLFFSALISVLTAFQFWASARHLGHLSDRIPATGLPKYASALFWVCAVAMVIGIIQSIAG